MAWLLKLIGGAKIYLILGAVIAGLGGTLYWLIGKNAELRYESRQKSEAIKIYADSFERESQKLETLGIRFQAARSREFESSNIIHNANIEELIDEDPEMVADSLNDLFNGLFDAVEQAAASTQNSTTQP